MKHLLAIPCLLVCLIAGNASAMPQSSQFRLTEISASYSFFGKTVEAANATVYSTNQKAFQIDLELTLNGCPPNAACSFMPNTFQTISFRVIELGQSCGSVVMTGVSDDGLTITLTDHRTRLCDDFRLYDTEVLVSGPNGDAYFGGSRVVNTLPPPTCMAYWSGAIFDATTNSCQMIGASGCQNPFEYRSLQQCEAAHGLR